MYNENDLAYMAGSMEADGCWHVGSSVSMRLTNKSKVLLEWAKKLFGGAIRAKSTPAECYEWNLSGKAAISLTEQLSVFVKFKTEEITLWKEYQTTIGSKGRKTSLEVLEKRELLKKMITQARDKRNGK